MSDAGNPGRDEEGTETVGSSGCGQPTQYTKNTPAPKTAHFKKKDPPQENLPEHTPGHTNHLPAGPSGSTPFIF